MSDALDHAYFTGPHISSDGSEHATHAEALQHLQQQSKGPSSILKSDVDSTVTASTAPYPQKGRVGPSGLKIFERMKIISDAVVDPTNDETINERVSDEDNPFTNFENSSNDGDELDSESEKGKNELSSSEQDWNGSSHVLVTPDVVSSLNFTCGVCGRTFTGDFNGCHNHVLKRKHGKRCNYSTMRENEDGKPAVTLLPSCLSEHSMLPIDEHSGWCELQGRRTYIEDIHSAVFATSYKLLGVFDGHFGNKVSLYA